MTRELLSKPIRRQRGGGEGEGTVIPLPSGEGFYSAVEGGARRSKDLTDLGLPKSADESSLSLTKAVK